MDDVLWLYKIQSMFIICGPATIVTRFSYKVEDI